MPEKAPKTRIMLIRSSNMSNASNPWYRWNAGNMRHVESEPGKRDIVADQGEAGEAGDLLTWGRAFDHVLSSSGSTVG